MKTKRIALYGLLVALAMIFSYLESLVPAFFAVPGIKLGLPNIAVIFALYTLSFRDAAVISLVRVFLVSVLFGSVLSMVYSLAGAVLSLLVMLLLYKSGKFSVTGVSVAGAVAHNAGQIITAMILLETKQIVFYLPVLCVSGTLAGVGIGIVSAIVIKRLKARV